MEREHTLPSFQEEDDPYALLWPGLNTAPIRAYVSGVDLPGWREQADDIAHDIFQEAVIRASQETRPIQNISAYLTKVAYHYFVDLYRQAKSELRLVETIGQTQLRDEETSFEQQMQALMDSSNNFRDYGFILDEETCILYMILLDYGLDHYGEVIVDDEFSCYALSFPRAQLGYVRDAVTRIYQGEPLISEQTYRQKQREYNSELVRTFGQALPEPCQSILRLYYLEQCTLGEIVNHVQLPLSYSCR